MKHNKNRFPNFIIAGTIKAATSSVFTYLIAHPKVCGSSIKETGFFVDNYRGNRAVDLINYQKYFNKCKSGVDIIMEASPGYLGDGAVVAHRIKAMLPDIRLLFILRDPVDRLYSYYNFHVGQVTKDFATELDFTEYIHQCDLYSSNKDNDRKLIMHKRHLRALEIGQYTRYLKEFYSVFSRDQIHIKFFEDLREDVQKFTKDLCCFLDLDGDFYRNYYFDKINATSTSRIKLFHYIALQVNRKLERFLRHRPGMKRKIVSIYKVLNQKNEGYPPIPESTRLRLHSYYKDSNQELRLLVDGEDYPPWLG